MFVDVNADLIGTNEPILQVPLDPINPMQLTVYVRHREFSLWSILRRKNRKVFFDESFDPLTLFGFQGILLGKGEIELGIAVRLWPTPDCETIYQELISEETPKSTMTR